MTAFSAQYLQASKQQFLNADFFSLSCLVLRPAVRIPVAVCCIVGIYLTWSRWQSFKLPAFTKILRTENLINNFSEALPLFMLMSNVWILCVRF